MDTPLHYAPVAVLESLTIRRGIAPVSAGQEIIGGQINAVTYRGDYGNSNEYELGGRLYVGGQSVNDGGVGSVFVSLANRDRVFRAMLMREEASDSEFADGTMRYRRTLAEGDNTHFVIDLELPDRDGTWKAGIDGNFENHDATIGNPNAAAFAINSFSDVTRDILGLYAERSQSITGNIGLDAGLRLNRVTMNSGPVSANLNPMNMGTGMPFMMSNMAGMLAMQFNNSDLNKRDYNTDWFARLSIDTGSDLVWYVGAAQKMRAPSYQERYLWLPLGVTAGLADGNLYIGNPELEPEVSHEVEIGFDLDAGRFSFYPRLFVRDVKDYIQGTPSSSMLANNFAQMMANMGMGQPNPLQWNNVDARFLGMDMEASFRINSSWQLRAVGSIIEGERRDIDDNLYRISPDNILVALDYLGNQWTGSLETVSYADQERVSSTNREMQTDGYTLLNLSASYRPTPDSELGIGVNNLMDKNYENHLGGYNRAMNPDIPIGTRVPGLGRSFYGRLMWYF